jgi:hypothetical protein
MDHSGEPPQKTSVEPPRGTTLGGRLRVPTLGGHLGEPPGGTPLWGPTGNTLPEHTSGNSLVGNPFSRPPTGDTTGKIPWGTTSGDQPRGPTWRTPSRFAARGTTNGDSTGDPPRVYAPGTNFGGPTSAGLTRFNRFGGPTSCGPSQNHLREPPWRPTSDDPPVGMPLGGPLLVPSGDNLGNPPR